MVKRTREGNDVQGGRRGERVAGSDADSGGEEGGALMNNPSAKGRGKMVRRRWWGPKYGRRS